MPQWSLSIWLKTILLHRNHRNDAKSLPTNTSWKRPRPQAILDMMQTVDDKLSFVTIASARVSSIAARGVQDIIKAQAGASTTSHAVSVIASRLSQITKFPMCVTALNERRARDAAKNTVYPTKVELKGMSACITYWAHGCDLNSRDLINEMKRADGKFARKSLRVTRSLTVTSTACAEVACTIAEIVEAHSIIFAQSKKPIPSLEELLLGIHIATTKAVSEAAETVTFVDRGLPPPYENNSN